MNKNANYVLWGLTGCGFEKFEYEDTDTLFEMMNYEESDNRDNLEECGYFDYYSLNDYETQKENVSREDVLYILNNLIIDNKYMEEALKENRTFDDKI